MKLFSLFLLVFSVAAAAPSTGMPPQNLDEFFGSEANRRIVAEAKQIDACVLRHTQATRSEGNEGRATEDRYDETTFVALPAATAAKLREWALDPRSYPFASVTGDGIILSKFCVPVYQVRLRFREGAKTAAIDFCFGCAIARLVVDGREVARTDFDPSYERWRKAFLALFPDDPELKKTKPKP